MEKIIELTNIKKKFGDREILKGVNFHLKKNENVVILGKSGSGKSVIMKMIVGLIEPDEGEIIVLGNNINHLNDKSLLHHRQNVGYVFQDGALYDSMTVEENIAFSLKRQIPKKKSSEIDSLVKNSLDSVGMLKDLKKMPDELSGGMKKRVALARTLVLEPGIILYDEPTAGLDPVTSKEIIKLILEMKNKYGISSIIATHDLICTKMTADRIIILHEGRIAAEGTFEEFENSSIDFIRTFFNLKVT